MYKSAVVLRPYRTKVPKNHRNKTKNYFFLHFFKILTRFKLNLI